MTQNGDKDTKAIVSGLEKQALKLGVIKKRLSSRDRNSLKGKVISFESIGKKYVLESFLGKGTYGEVWKATDKSLERPVAIKILHGGITDFEQLKAEGKALSPLTHKNILVVHDLGYDEKNGWLVTEFVDGPSLQEYLVDKARNGEWLSFEEARVIMEQCLAALEFSHDRNRVHGDIKPGNIFVPKTGEIKLGDFGVAKILGQTHIEAREYSPWQARRLGSSSYAAPEVLDGQPRDFQSDLFSMGILAYVLLTGRHPFVDKSGLLPIVALIRSKTFTPERPSAVRGGIPEKYDSIVMRLLEKDRSKRFSKAREVLDQWKKHIETIDCPRCSAENPLSNKYCGQCGSNLRAISKAKSKSEKAVDVSFALFTTGQSDKAIDLLKGALEENPRYSEGWANLGYMLNHERRYEEAESACTKSISIAPNLSRAYQTRGFARSNLGRFEEAISDFTMALERETDERRRSLILYQRGYSKKLFGDFEGASRDASLSIKLDKTNTKGEVLKRSVESLIKRRH